MNLLWARHGQNAANLTRTLSYRVYDRGLTDTGRRQAGELAERLAAAGAGPIGLLACSPLRRARQTAGIVGARLGLPVGLVLDDLREVDVGDLDGRSDAGAWDTYTRVLAAWRAGDTRARFPGGEDRDELCARLRRALARWRAARPGRAARAERGRWWSPTARACGPRCPAWPGRRTRAPTCRPAGSPSCAWTPAAPRTRWSSCSAGPAEGGTRSGRAGQGCVRNRAADPAALRNGLSHG